jgi:twinkle protein
LKTFADYGIEVSGGSGEVSTTCPKCSHDRKKKSAKCLSVNVDEGVWYCHHCQWTGSLNNKRENMRIENHHTLEKKTYSRPSYTPPQSVPSELKKWGNQRGISEEVMRRNKISIQGGMIQFPYYKNGEVINIKQRGLEDKTKQRLELGAELNLYGYDDIDNELTIWVEGEPDKLAVESAGFKNCVSVPNGAKGLTFFENCRDRLDEVKAFIWAGDNDSDGRMLESEMVRRLGPERFTRVTWPPDCKDANDVLMKHGANTLKECVEKAKPYPIEGLFCITDITEEILDLYDNGMPGGVYIGWDNLKDLYAVRPGEWTLVTGIPSHGKSEFLDALMINLTQLHDWKFALCSPENQPLKRHMAKLLEKSVGKPFRNGPRAKMDSPDLMQGLAWLNDHVHFILPPDDDLTVEHILSIAKGAVLKYGINGLIIDPWNELDHSRPNNMSETDYISQSLTKIRQFARRHEVHVWVVSHPTKMQKDSSGNYPIPTPYDVSGSAHWRNKADNCLAVWRDLSNPDGQEVQIHIQKIRFKENGQIGHATLFYDKVTGRYFDEPVSHKIPETEEIPF